MVQSLDGLSYFHTQMGYVHRDLKPENIFLKKDKAGEFIVKVGDYSLARSYILHGETITRQENGREAFYTVPGTDTRF